MDQTLESAAIAAREALGGASEVIGCVGDVAPRYELFHGANSICSHKVRCVLAHHKLPYVSCTVNMFLGQTYLPAYVRLRMIGCDRFGGELAARHSGSTSASVGGCDGAVVPTLIDWHTGEVVVDSKRICIYLDDQTAETDRLRPARLSGSIDDELTIVDNLPNYQMLMGRTQIATEDSSTKDSTGATFSLKKVAMCERYLAENSRDGTLVRAYTAKRAKELSAANELFAPEAMKVAYDRTERGLRELERKLEHKQNAWLFDAAPTMADLFWAIELLRMRNVGAAGFWERGRLPRVECFLAAAETLSSIRTSVINWPGAMF